MPKSGKATMANDGRREEAPNVDRAVAAFLARSGVDLEIFLSMLPVMSVLSRRTASLPACVEDEPACGYYSSRPPGQPCPGHSHRWTRDNAHAIPGAVRVGGARGRNVEWRVPVEAWRAWLAAQTTKTATIPASAKPADDVEAWIANAGLRLTRKAG